LIGSSIGAKPLFYKHFIILSLLITTLFIPNTTPASPSPGWSWLSIGSNGENTYLGSGIRNPKFCENLGFEIGTCVTDKENIPLSFDVLGFKDTSANISLYGGLGLYSSFHDTTSQLNLAGSGGIWFDFDKFKLGLGYHSNRGMELKFGADF
jgi:hypothetical protein